MIQDEVGGWDNQIPKMDPPQWAVLLKDDLKLTESEYGCFIFVCFF